MTRQSAMISAKDTYDERSHQSVSIGGARLRYRGKVTEWQDSRGFGFVTPSLGGDSIFLHFNAIVPRARRPAQGDLVTYELTHDARRRPRASKVRFASESATHYPYRRASAYPMFAACAFILALAALVVAGRLPPGILVLYLTASILAF